MVEDSTWLVVLLTSLGGVGTVSFFVWKIYELIEYYLWKNYAVSLKINTKDPMYDWIVLWLKQHGPINDSNHWTIKTKGYSSRYTFMPSVPEAEEDKIRKTKFEWRPRPGTWVFKHPKTGQWMRLRIQKNEEKNEYFYSADASGFEMKDWEIITLEMFGNSIKCCDNCDIIK